MKKTLLLAGVLLALTASIASAAGVNYYWNDCSTGGATAKVFTCTNNTGTNVSYASFDPPPQIDAMNGSAILVDLQSATTPLPQWWAYKNAGTCRLASLTVNADFTANTNCADFWVGGATAGIGAYTIGFGDPARARLTIAVAVPGTGAGPVLAGTEYYDIKISFNNLKSVGTGSCTGCLDPVCLVLNDIQLTQATGATGGSPHITNPRDSNFITWQGGAIGGAGCPGATPATSRTWGQLKSIYR